MIEATLLTKEGKDAAAGSSQQGYRVGGLPSQSRKAGDTSIATVMLGVACSVDLVNVADAKFLFGRHRVIRSITRGRSAEG